jgi:hypothetical protein
MKIGFPKSQLQRHLLRHETTPLGPDPARRQTSETLAEILDTEAIPKLLQTGNVEDLSNFEFILERSSTEFPGTGKYRAFLMILKN